MTGQGQLPDDAEFEKETEDFMEAEKALEEQEAEKKAERGEEETKEQQSAEKEETEKEKAERYQDILVGLGFKRWDNEGEIKCSVIEDGMKIGRTFNGKTPTGRFWAFPFNTNEKGEFLSEDELKELPLVKRFNAIRDGKEPVPEPTVTGKIVEKRGKAIGIEIEEQGEQKKIYFGAGAVKKDEDGYFIPKGFSRATQTQKAKMGIPRDIKLPNYEAELEAAPVTQPTGNGVMQEKQPIDRAQFKEQIAGDMRWAAQKIRDIYLEEIKDKVEMNDTEQFIEKGMITMVIRLSDIR